MKLEFTYEDETFQQNNELEKIMQQLADSVEEHSDTPIEVGVTFVNDDQIKMINHDNRGIDSSTDVLSFPMYEDLYKEALGMNTLEGTKIEYYNIGDIIISVPTAQRQAEEYNHSFFREICYLFIHGLMHLFGYDHIDDDDKQLMRQKEEYYLNKAGLSRD